MGPTPVRSAFAVAALLAALSACALVNGRQATATEKDVELDVPYVQTPQPIVDRMLELAAPTPNDLLYDLGSGDGRIVVTAAARYGTRGVGIDIDPARVEDGKRNAEQAGVTHLTRFVQQDLFEADFSDATIVTMYLLSSVNLQLRPKLLDQLRPGTRIVSHSFDMDDWEPDRVVEVTEGARGTIYYWVIPAKVEGAWDLTLPSGTGSGSGPARLELDQEFQKVNGTATIDGRKVPVEGRLTGDRITLVLRDRSAPQPLDLTLEGHVDGSRIAGLPPGGAGGSQSGAAQSGAAGGSGQTWSARRTS
ncbi:MAG TPA: class I SAM-dependent methyltransferase [Thermodesulfobacteriota bacterium]